MRNRGFTLIEVLIVMVVMGILLSIATMNWNDMQRKSSIETQVKTLQTDLMTLRLDALHTQRPRTVVLTATTYNAYSSDITAGVNPVSSLSRTYKNTMVWNAGGGTLTFDSRGLAFGGFSAICIGPATKNPAFVDSLIVSTSRVNLGKRDGGICGTSVITQR